MNAPRRLLLCSLTVLVWPAFSAESSLIVVQDFGGVSALPYYRALGLPSRKQARSATQTLSQPTARTNRYREADLLPVRSKRLTIGPVARRALRAPGLPAIFLIGDDAQSRAWLNERIDRLRALHAIGFVVQVESQSALDALRTMASGLTLAPVSGDDLAGRLNLQHYPVLITATGIEP